MKPQRPKRTDDKLSKLIIQRMKQLRAEHNYTQEYVIENTDRLNIAQYEAGILAPSLVSLTILCRLYGISLREFFAPIEYPQD